MTVISMIGQLGPAQLACFRSWRRIGLRTQFIHTGSRPLCRFARGIADYYVHLGPTTEASEYFNTIGEHLRMTCSVHLASSGDQMSLLLWRHIDQLGPSVTLLMAQANVIDAMESKILQIHIARQCGFDLLPTTLVSTANLAECAKLTYPVVVRPDRASIDSSFKAVFLTDSFALKAFFSSRDSHNLLSLRNRL